VLYLRDRLATPLQPLAKAVLDDTLCRTHREDPLRTLVIGAAGRGPRVALTTAAITRSCWDIAEIRQLNRTALLGHELLVNTVLNRHPITPSLAQTDLAESTRRLTMLSDVTCDVGSDCNVLPVYNSTTSWKRPTRRLRNDFPPLDILAIETCRRCFRLKRARRFRRSLRAI
jgi:saccharopine dehydrogenase (NAD+, L-lysine-forming)